MPVIQRPRRPEGVLAHQLRVLGQGADEGEDDQEQDGVEGLGEEEELDQWGAGDEDDRCGDEDDRAEAEVEGPRLGEAVVDVGAPAQGLGDRVGGGERDDRRGQQGGAEEAEAEEGRGEVAGERFERLGGVAGVVRPRCPRGAGWRRRRRRRRTRSRR